MVKHQPKDVRRRQFFEAAMQLIAEKGFYKMRVEDIAERAGLSKGSFYHHFKSKEEVCLEMMSDMSHEMRELFRQDRQRLGSAKESLSHIWAHFSAKFGPQVEQLVPLLGEFISLSARDKRFASRFRQAYQEALEALAELIRWGQELGEFKAQVDPMQAARLYVLSGDGLGVLYGALGLAEHLFEDGLVLATALEDFFSLPAAPSSRLEGDNG
jgi:AcrR family transcriptional regulator